MADMFPITLEDQIAEVEREVQMRERVYRRRIEQGKMTQMAADRQIDVMKAVAATLRRVKETET